MFFQHDEVVVHCPAGRAAAVAEAVTAAGAQATRLLPNIATVLGWESCDHVGPVHEGDTLYSELHVDGAVPLPDHRGGVLKLRSLVYAVGDGAEDRQVLDWRFTALQF